MKIKSFIKTIFGINKSKDFYSAAYKCKIYMPYYNLDTVLDSEAPEIYNKDGAKMDAWFIRDFQFCHSPYNGSSKYFLWDRFNIGLNTHFYTHEAMLETMGNPIRKYGMFLESEFIVPDSYRIFERNKGLHKDFDAVFTYSEKLLNSLPNAKLFTSCATLWYGQEKNCTISLADSVFKAKTKNVSMICSNKLLTRYHAIRHHFADIAKQTGRVDLFGTYNGGEYLQFKSDSLQKYRFQIVVENGISPYYFTEKILDCFASMTVPIYLGASKISSFFNPDGIMFLHENGEELEKIIKSCDEKLYEKMLPAIIDNYKRVLPYRNMNDRLFEEYFT